MTLTISGHFMKARTFTFMSILTNVLAIFSLNFKDLDIRHPENNVFYVTIVSLFTLTALNFLHSQKPFTLYFSGFLSNGGYDK